MLVRIYHAIDRSLEWKCEFAKMGIWSENLEWSTHLCSSNILLTVTYILLSVLHFVDIFDLSAKLPYSMHGTHSIDSHSACVRIRFAAYRLQFMIRFNSKVRWCMRWIERMELKLLEIIWKSIHIWCNLIHPLAVL